ncbi:MAG: DMT family transporter, partial [Actinomycetota bacterium]|nr:DMT family transporter [Actinomycetota bacterium]
SGGKPTGTLRRSMSQILALSSAVFYGLGDFLGGISTRRASVWTVTAWSQTLGLGVLAIGLLVVPADLVTTSDILWGALAGAVGLVGLVLLYSTLASGSMTIVAPIAGATTAVIPVVVDLSRGAELSTRHWIGIGLALGAVLLIGSDPASRGADIRIVARAVLAGAAFGVFFIALAQTSEVSGLWPLVGARATTIPIAFAIAGFKKVAAPPGGRGLGMLAALGNLDMAANVSIALALQRGPLGISTVLSSLYPAFTAITAVIVLHERPRPGQTAGIVLAMGAIVALAF